MKKILTKLFYPILSFFESGDGEYAYKKSHRTILFFVGSLFCLLSASVFFVGSLGEGLGFLLPGLVFGLAALITIVVAGLGSDRAVAKIWGSRR